jgi:hypothetical protein|tara:strand:+ start:114 stop:239 length:126 start_codon:yes stop_codon:yes gene_type:complete
VILPIAKPIDARHDGQQITVASCFFAILFLFDGVKDGIVLH